MIFHSFFFYYSYYKLKEMSSLQLVQQNVKKININLCIICQKSKPREKLSSTDTGRNKLLSASNILKDGLFDEFNDNDMSSVKYHSNSCYKPYTLKSERQLKINETAELSSIDNCLVEDEPSLDVQPRAKRRKSSDVDTPKICIMSENIFRQGQQTVSSL